MVAIGNSLTKSHSSQTLSYTLQDIQTVIYKRIFSFGFNNFINLSTTLLLNAL